MASSEEIGVPRSRGRRRRLATVAVAGTLFTLVAMLPAPGSAAPGPSPAASRSTAPGPLALPILPRSSAYVSQMFEALARREPSGPETRYVGVQLDAGTSPVAIADGLVRSDVYLQPRIVQLYQRLLDRTPGAAEVAFWAGRVHAAGRSIESVVAQIVGSHEFLVKAGQTSGGFVTRAYQRLFGAAPDTAGRNYWVGRLDAGATSAGVATALIHFDRYARPLVAQLYRVAVDRPVDPSGAAYWSTLFLPGRVGEIDILANLLGGAEAAEQGCDPLVGRACLLPFPNDYFTVPDSATATGRRVAFKQSFMPANKDGRHVDPTEWNRNDGFSPGQAILVHAPGIDLTRTGAAPLTDIGRSLDPAAPIFVVDAATGERQPVFVELDANITPAEQAADQLVYIRPAKNWQEGHRYIVVLRNLRTGTGATMSTPDAFRRYRDGLPSDIGGFERRRPHMEAVFSDLSSAGIARSNLFLAWDFTVASTNNVTGRLRYIRDDALARLGGRAPAFTVTKVEADSTPGVARRISGTFDVPLYLTGTGSPGNAYATGFDGLPVASGTITAKFTCRLPETSLTTPARGVVYGHGLFGGQGEVGAGNIGRMVADHNMAYCATDWLGMSEEDIGNAATILTDLSTFKTLGDRSQQGILDTIYLARLIKQADGFASNPAFRNTAGQPALVTGSVFYDGNSQGGVIGGAYLAVSPDVVHGVLGVAGMNYSMLVERSADFDPFNQLYRPSYPDAVQRVLGLGLIQMLWDRGETNGYAAHMTTDPLPGTGPHKVLIDVAYGDHQVAPLAAEVEARTAGLSVHEPPYAPGRSPDVVPSWGIPRITTYPLTGSALFIFDSGAASPPLGNVAPRTGFDPHEDPRNAPAAQQQKSDFLQTDGVINNACGPLACTAPHA